MIFLLEDGNVLFTGALVLMLMIAVLEGVLTMIGMGLSSLLDSAMPDLALDTELAAPEAPGGLSKLLSWLRVGEVPALILLVVFLLAFGITGLVLQLFASSLLGSPLPGWLLAVPVLLLALPQVRMVGNLLRRFAIGDESEAVGRASFVGKVAVITLGEARASFPAEARFADEFGTTHYVMVEPDGDETFTRGEQVLLVEDRGATFRVIRPSNQHLTEKIDN